jgi:hypothetical protein
MLTKNITPKPALMKKVLLRTISAITLVAVLFSTISINAKPADLKPVFIGLNDAVLNSKAISDATLRKPSVAEVIVAKPAVVASSNSDKGIVTNAYPFVHEAGSPFFPAVNNSQSTCTTGTAIFTYDNGVITNNFQSFTVPQNVTEVTIEAYGANGGNAPITAVGLENGIGGIGAYLKGKFSVQANDVLSIITGQRGGDGSASADFSKLSGGGGGGSFVTKNNAGFSLESNLLVAAGGGGGGGYGVFSTGFNKNANSNASGFYGSQTSIAQPFDDGSTFNGAGGNPGFGGSNGNNSGGGAGFNQDGFDASYLNNGLKPSNGADGGRSFDTWNVDFTVYTPVYGFGGYGGGGASITGGGGGGGYSGGGGGKDNGYGGGGGSYIGTTIGAATKTPLANTNASPYYQNGNGVVIITWTIPVPVIKVFGNSILIPGNATNTPVTADNTDFGTSVPVSSTVSQTFTIKNDATNVNDLTVSAIATDNGLFTLDATSITLPATISAGNSTTFKVKYTPTATGTHTAKVTVTSSDCVTGPYIYNIKGNAGSSCATPNAPSGTNGSRCGTGSVSISAAAGAGETIDWYAAATGGTPLASGTSYSTPSISTTTIYYAEAKNTAGGCVSTTRTPVTATVNTLPSVTAGSNSPVCSGTTLTLSSTAGMSSYSWSGPNSFTSSVQNPTVSNNASAVMAGTYTVTVTDANGCTNTGSVIIAAPTVVNFTTAVTNVLCFGTSTGSITVTPSSGAAPYTYSKNGGTSYQASNSFTTLAAGTYSIIVKDANNCTATAQSVTITQPAAGLNVGGSGGGVLCFGSSTGHYTLTATGGTAPYTYSKDGITFQSSNNFTGLSAGSYTLITKDANGCTSSLPVSLAQPAVLTLTPTVTAVACFGGSNGAISIAGTGGSSPYTYSKDGGATFQSGNSFGSLAAGTYNIVIKDINACTATQSVSVGQPVSGVSFTSTTVSTCSGQSNGSITVTANGGSSPYTYSKDGGTTYQTGNLFSGLAAGNYSIVVKDAGGCTGSSTVTVAAYTLPTVAISPSSVSITTGNATNLTASGAVTYVWSPATGLSATSGTSVTAGPTSTTTYTVTGTDANGCVNTATSTVTVTSAIPATALNFDGVDDKVTVNNTLGNFGAGDFTIEMSVRTTLSSGVEYLASKRGICGGDNFWSLQIVNGVLDMEMAQSATIPTNYVALHGSRFISDGVWHHVALTRRSGTVNIYVDGALETSSTATVANINNNYTLEFGSSVCNGQNGSVKFRGDMDEIRIWNRALCTGELDHYRTCELSLPQAGLQGYFKLNAGNINANNAGITTAVDATGNGNNGTLNNFGLTGATSNWVAGTVIGTCSPYVVTIAPITGNASVCVGATTQLSDATSNGTWSSSNSTIASVSATGLVTGNVAGTAVITFTSLCDGVATLTVTVNQKPTVTITPSSVSIVNGSSTTLTAGGATTYAWSPSATLSAATGTTVTATPTTTTTYTVIGTDANTCSNTATATVTVTFVPATALNFDGVDDYVSATGYNVGTGNFTIEAWIKPTAFVQSGIIVQGGYGFAKGYLVDFNATGQGTLRIETAATVGTGNGSVSSPLNAIALNTWQHIAISVTRGTSGNLTKMYVNGVLVASGNIAAGDLANTTLNIGRITNNGNYFPGSIDEVRIWSRALCQSEIQANMNCEEPAAVASLQANYHLNQGNINADNTGITTAFDATANGRNGTLNNFTLNGATSNWVAGIAAGTCSVYTASVLPITGNAPICLGATLQLSDATSGGTWSSSNTAVATVSASGLVTSVSAGTTTISYTTDCGAVATVTVTVNANVTPIFTQVAAICSGTTLSALPTTSTNGITGTWSPALNNTATTTYTFTPGAGQCATTATMTITVNAAPTVFTIGNTGDLCATGPGYYITLSGSDPGGVVRYEVWRPGNGTGITVMGDGNPLNIGPMQVSGTFFIVATNTVTNCTSTMSGSITVNLTSTVTPTFTQVAAICPGATLSALPTTSTNGISGTWSPALNNTATTTYTFTPNVGQCASTATMTITVNALPNATANNNGPACNGGSLSLTASGGVSYLWSGPNGFNSTSSNTGIGGITAAWAGVYTVQVTDANGCVNTATTTVVVNSIAPIGGLDHVCAGSTTTLTGSGTPATTNPWWSNNQGVATINNAGVVTGIAPGSTLIIYTNSSGCTVNIFFTVNALPNAPTGTNAAACAPSGVTISASGAVGETINWFAAATGGSQIGTGNTFYTNNSGTFYAEAVSAAGCVSATRTAVTATVNPLPIISGGAAAICINGTTTFNGSGTPAVVNPWVSSNPAIASVDNAGVVTGHSSGSVQIMYTTSGGCTATVSVFVSGFPGVGILPAGSAAICAGSSVTLNSNSEGGLTYVWTPGGATTSSITVNTAGTYTLEGTNSFGCKATASVTVTVNALPNAPTGTNASACAPNGVNISASGAVGETIKWYTTATGGTPISVGNTLNTNVSGTFYAEAVSAAGCVSATRTAVVATITPLTTPTFTQVAAICSGTTLSTLPTSSNNGITGTWSPALNNTATTTYTFTPNAGQCATTTTMTITVNPLPTITGTLGVCPGSSRQLTGSGTPAASNPWTSSNPSVATVDNSGLVTGLTSGTTTITYTNANGCSITTTFTVFATPPTPTVSAVDNCDGTSILTASGFTNFEWRNGARTVVIATGTSFITVNTAGTYAVRSVGSNCVSSFAFVNAAPNTAPNAPTSGGDQSRCGAGNITLSATPGAGETIDWYSAASGGTLLQSGSTTYIVSSAITVYAEARNTTSGCVSATRTAVVATINPVPTATISAVGSTSVCPGNTVTLNANTGSGYTYQWLKNSVNISGATGASYIASVSGSYTVIITNSFGCVSAVSNAIAVTVQDNVPPVIPTLNPITAECFASAPTPNATDACTGNVVGVPSGPTSFNTQGDHIIHWTFTDGNGNSSSADQHVIILDVTPPVPVCPSSPIILTATSTVNGYGASYDYSNAATATDNCQVQSIVYSPAANTFFGVGTHAVTVTVTDVNGLTAQCSFNVIVNPGPIDAVDDDYTSLPINGAHGGTTPVVLTNDLLNNASFTISQVNLTLVNDGGITGLTFDANGSLIIPAGTWEGDYSVVYRICEKANPTNCDQAVVRIRIARGLRLIANSYCNNDVPYVHYEVIPNFTPDASLPVTLTWLNGDGSPVAAQPVLTGLGLTGDILWPGAILDAQGQPIDWPGWFIQNGLWVQGADGFEGTRPNAYLQISVNPTETIQVSYPPATPACNAAPTNHPPVAHNDIATTEKCNGATISVLSNDSDFENGTLTVSVSSATSANGGTVVVNNDGTITYTPAYGFFGSDNFSYTVTDPAGLTATATVTIDVVDHTPPVVPVLSVINQECSATVPVATTTDPCGGSVTGTTSDPLFYNTQGEYDVHWSFTDGHGNTSTAVQHVIVKDVTRPIVHCPGTITVTANTTDGHGLDGAIVNFNAPATDNCTVPTVSYSIQPNSFFAVGTTTTVTVTADDGNGNIATCTFDVVVNCVPPVITSTQVNQTINTTLGRCDAPATYTVTASGIPAANLSYAFAGATSGSGSGTGSGSIFNKGITTVTVTATNSCGSVSSTFTVTVEDHENPAIVNLPANITKTSDAGVCGAVVTWPAVTATDNCPIVSLVSDHNSGDTYPVGTTTVHYTATDASHNTISGSFDVTVSDNERPTFTCPTDIVVSANTTDGHGVDGYIATYSVTDAHDNCSVASTTYSIPSGSFFPIGNTPVVITVTDVNGNPATCTLHVIVNCVPPVITVSSSPVNQTINTTLGRCDAPATYTVTATGIPAANLSYTFTGATTGNGSGTGSGSVFNKGETVVTVTATNSCGSISTHFTITVEDHENPVIVNLPHNINKTNDAGVCGAAVTWGAVTVTDNCPDPMIVSDHNSGEVFPIGTTTVHYTATDASGNAASGSFDVVVTDTENPVITVPADIEQPADAGKCTYTFTAPAGPNAGGPQHPGGPGGGGSGSTSLSAYIGTATATDNCNTIVITAVRNDNAGLNDPYPVGVTIITWTATDAYGHTDSHNQTITIRDDEFPTITPPNAVTVPVDANSCTTAAAHVTLGNPVTGDNCAVQSISNDAPASFLIGTTTVTWSVTDIHGHTSTATQIVTVVDDQKPSFTCPGDITLPGAPGLNGANISSYTITDAADNCGTPTVTYTINPGHFFTLGTTTQVTITVTDAAGNHVECTINVTVTNNPPVANPDFATTPEDTPVNGNVLTNDTDLDGHALNVTGFEIGGTPYTTGSPVTMPGVGVIIINTNGSFTFTPAPNYNGPVPVITYYITDNHGGTASSTLTINVTPVNDLPVAANDTESVNEDGVLTSSVGGNDILSGDGGNVWSVVTTTTHGTLVFHPDGTYTYTPNANFNGTDVFTYKLCDVDPDCSVATVTITVNSVNDVPVAVNDVASVNEDGVLTSSVTGNDTPSGDGGNVWSVVTTTTHGTLVFHPDGTYTYTPNANFNGTDVFTYKLCDVDPDCSVATVTITVNSVNDVPVAANDTETIDEDNVLTSSVGGNDILSGDGGNVWSVVTTTTHGTLVFNPNGTYTYTPVANYHGTDVFTYTLCDVDHDCSTATVTITINSVDDPAVIKTKDRTIYVDATGHISITAGDIDDGSYDPDGIASITINKSNFDCSNLGPNTVTMTVTDVNGNSASAIATVTVLDIIKPTITCPAPVTVQCASDVPAVNIASVTAADNCSAVVSFISDVISNQTAAHKYTITRTYRATDPSGNWSECTQTITVNDNTKPVLTFGPLPGGNSGQCLAGAPAAPSATSIAALYSDNCSGTVTAVLTNTTTTGNDGSGWTRKYFYNVSDVSGNITVACVIYTGKDNIKPNITCPSDITVIASSTSAGQAGAIVTYTNPATATDNCGTPTITYSPASGSFFPTGINTVTVTADDGNGNTSTCNFKVIVTCVAPVFTTCSANITANTDPGVCSAVVTYPSVATGTPAAAITYTFSGATTGSGTGCGTGKTFNKGLTNVTVTATNLCGTATCSFTVTVVDNENPVIVNLPANISKTNDAGICGAAVTWATVSATDNCPGVTLTSNYVSGATFPVGTTTVNYTAKDVVGHTVTGSFTVTVTDTEKPAITCPANIIVNANTTSGGQPGAFVTYAASATDNCGTPTVTYSKAPGSFFPTGTTNVTVTAVDVKGNTSTCTFTVTVGCIAPVISITSVPANNTYTGGPSTSLFLGYGAQSTTLQVSAPAGSTYAWSGSGSNLLSSTTLANPVFTPLAGGSYTFTVAVTNTIGCKSTASITICVTDIRVLASTNNNDDDDHQSMCDHQSHDSTDCPHKGHNHSCNHKSHSKYSCEHRDTNDNDDDDEKDCDHKAHTAKDCQHKGHNHNACDHKVHNAKDCDHDKGHNNGQQKVCDHKAHSASDCSHDGHNHTYCSHKAHNAADCPHESGNKYGNSDNYKVFLCHVPPGNPGKTITLSISINAVAAHLSLHPGDRLGSCEQQPCSGYFDVTKPEIDCPSNITVSCGTSTQPSVTGAPDATDNSGSVTITYNDVTNSNVITRTWTATDANGNFSTCAQLITIVDNVKPVITDPADILVNCGGSTLPAATGTATATDNCSAVVISYTDATFGNVITRTWKATDVSGNYSTSTQKITIGDNIKPIISCPGNIIVSCGGSTAPAVTGFATATDNCSTPVITYSDVAGNNGVINRTWKATDASGNYSTCVQVISKPLTSPCVLPYPLVDLNYPRSNVVFNESDILRATDPGPSTTYNVTPTKIKLWYNDEHPLMMGVRQVSVKTSAGTTVTNYPISAYAGTASTVTSPSFGTTADYPSDQSGNDVADAGGRPLRPVIYISDITTDPNNRAGDWQHNGTAYNADMVSGSWKSAVRFVDKTKSPVVVTVTPDADPSVKNNWNMGAGADAVPSGLVNEGYGAEVVWNVSNLPLLPGHTYRIQFIVHDGDQNKNGGDAGQACTTIYIPMESNTVTVSCPGNTTVSCATAANPTVTGTATASSSANNGTVTVTYNDATNGNAITRTWKGTDQSGNYNTCVQTITVVDNVKPVITDPADITVSCGGSTLPAATGTATATDCSSVTVSYSDVISGNTITRTWKAIDASNNSSTSTQIITIVDNVKPVISDPADITVNCGASILPAATGTATATDNCSTPAVTYSDATNGNVISRTWTATDASGNTASSVQLITIGSTFTPVVTSVPTSSTYTGGVATNLYLGYGAQSTTLQIGSLPTAGAPYTYVWSGSYLNLLNSSTSAAPVFTPTTFGYYTYMVTVTNKFGCKSTANISICVTDIRVPGCNGSKVYVCHTPSYWWGNGTPQTLELSLSQVSSHLGSSYCGSGGSDRLGSSSQSPCNTTTNTSVTVTSSGTAKDGEAMVATSDEDLKVTAMPNPSTTFFTLKIESRFQTPVELRVMDGRGRVVDAKSKLGANSTIQIGHNYSSGTYYAELIQGTQRKVVQLIKGRG